jgi:hypothetical protein
LLTTYYGNVPYAEDLEDLVIGCTATSFTVESLNVDTSPGINLLGDDTLTIIGTNFPHEMTGNTFAFNFDNPSETACTIIATSSTAV